MITSCLQAHVEFDPLKPHFGSASGRALDSGVRGPGFEPHDRHGVGVSFSDS